MARVKHRRATRAQLNTAATNNLLLEGEVYLITDEGRIAIGLSTSTYETYAKESEGAAGSVTKSTATQLNEGSNDDTFPTPLRLKDSEYRRVQAGASAPADTSKLWLKPLTSEDMAAYKVWVGAEGTLPAIRDADTFYFETEV